MNDPSGSQCDLGSRECIPCKGRVPPLKGGELTGFERQLGAGWSVIDGHHLEQTFKFRNFREALAFTNRVGELAEQQGHHPDI